MALSRIWTAFIIVALAAALGRFLFESGQQQLFSHMVTGKNTDTVSSRLVPEADIPENLRSLVHTGKMAVWGKEKIVKESKVTYTAYPLIPINEQELTMPMYRADSANKRAFFPETLPAGTRKMLDSLGVATLGNDQLVKTETKKYIAFRLLPANGLFETAKDAVTLCLGLIGIMALFMGFMNIAEKAGGIRFLSRIIGPFFSRIFPEIPKNHPSMGHMVMNFSANLMGLDNAATPFGIKAMESLQEINPVKEKASNAQLMFMCLHASGLTLIPTVIIADRVALKAKYPTDIFIPCMIATFAATVAALSIVAIRQRIRLFQPVILAWILGITAGITALILFIRKLDAEGVKLFSTTLSNGIILLIFLLIVLGGIYKKTNIFDAFIEGAKGGFETAVRIIPYLV